MGYDCFKKPCASYGFDYPEDKLLVLAREVKKVVDAKARYTDWNQRDEVFKEIFEQAENFKKYK